MNSIISWIGGKKALRNLIYKRMPKSYEKYIEVFGGAGWVLFGKEPQKCMEVYNDFNSNLANLFFCVKEQPIEFLKELGLLANTLIENKDFEALIRQYNRPNAFFYCDPPYFQTEGYYEVLFKPDDHVRLRNTLKDIDGKFLLSYNDCEYIRQLYNNYYIEPISRANSLAQRYKKGGRFKELFISNYETKE